MPDRKSARELIKEFAEGFTDLPLVDQAAAETDGPIGWAGYDDARDRAAERTGERESVVCGTGDVGGVAAVLVVFEFGFLGGSLGRRTGDRIEAAFDYAIHYRLPVVTAVATGGSRMQEGMAALSQLQRIAAAAARVRGAGLPHVAVLRDPTTGGGWATLGAGADVTLALPGAQVGFAGSRVRPAGDDSAAAAYTAESQFAGGHVDRLVSPEDLPGTLASWLRLLTAPRGGVPVPPRALGAGTEPMSGWAAVRAARTEQRPRAEAYLDDYFDHREGISGDRCGGGVDPGVACGFGRRAGQVIAYAAQCGTATTPAGFRTAARLIRLADRLGIPVLTLVDTPGAANDAAAERAGIGGAIAEVFAAVASARVPVSTLVIGEGGSGGALAFAAPGRTWMTPDSYFSVTSPEAAASILKRAPDEVPATADQLRLRPSDVVALGTAEGIVTPRTRS
ncbi:acetyl-CoA carboxylase carboxyl transferase subunit beta [Amycolatopsis marina]|uniref:Acetyl-coenzyme A carboxylase carboxyl transferase subunits beta/alpha n=1 Tax=Amycolatopsis marina TaxID=490629 RepID=A0A1I1A2P9_9PSEU|nr:carboxyl transferase domain-containing protein [Amycolatopsis marina]SFB31792.1 acetyl-CoA carboxylase carboxyl transferase subunit beta [Amycolatopsis marina]